MAITLRLTRFGKRGFATYRIIAIDKRKKRDTEYVEKIGSYNPHLDKKTALVINKERLEYWRSKGAQVSEGFAKLVKFFKV